MSQPCADEPQATVKETSTSTSALGTSPPQLRVVA